MEPIDQDLHRRVAVTGLGLVGPFGFDRDGLWQAVHEGVPFETAEWRGRTYLAGPSRQPDLRRTLRTSEFARMPHVAQYTLFCIHQALAEAGFVVGRTVPEEAVAIVFGTSNGPGTATQEIYDDLIANGPAAVKPRVFQESVFNAPASHASIYFGIKGPILVAPAGACAGSYVLYQAELLLARPEIRAVVAVCADELCSGLQYGLHCVGLMSPNDGGEPGARPFDRRANGAVMAEAGIALVLERLADANTRGASPLAEIAGVGIANDAFRLACNSPDGRGLTGAVRSALTSADIHATEVDLVLSGAACTAEDERLEEAALRTVFGATPPAVASTKGALGFPMGAASFVDVATAVAALERRAIPATYGLVDRRADCGLAVEPQGRAAAGLRTVLVDAIAVNGLFGAVLVRKAT